MNVNEVEKLADNDASIVGKALRETLDEFQTVLMFEMCPNAPELKDKNVSYLKWLSGEYKALTQAFIQKLAEKVIFEQERRQKEDGNETEKESNDCDTGPILGTGTCEED